MTVDVKDFGKITASKKVLNKIILLMHESAELDELKAEKTRDDELKSAYKEVAEMTRGYASDIHKALDEVGYYDDVRK